MLKSDSVERLRADLRDGVVDADIRNFNYLIRVMGAQGQLNEITSVLDDIRAAGLSPNLQTFNAMLAACAEKRNIAAAWEVMSAMKARGVWGSRKLITLLYRGLHAQ